MAKKDLKMDVEVPTREEIWDLKQTQELFKSNIFKLQIEELLSEVTIGENHKGRENLELLLHTIKEVLDSLPNGEVSTQAGESMCGVKLHRDTVLTMQFQKPSRVDLIGSYLSNTMVKPNLNVDMAVEMPRSCFLEKDFRDYRYFDKRALYLSALERSLRAHKSLSTCELSICSFRGDKDKPVLCITQTKKGLAKKFTIRLFPALSPDTFKASRLGPDRCCVRQAEQPTPGPPTPFYNQCVLEDMFFRSHVLAIHNVAKECPAFVQAVQLLKVWARQRNFCSRWDASSKKSLGGTDGSHGEEHAVNGFLISMVLLHLINGRTVVRHMSCYQMARAALQFLAGDALLAGIKMKCEGSTGSSALSDFTSAFEVALIGPSGVLNLAARVSRSALLEVQMEAAVAFEQLEDSRRDHFPELFLTPVEFAVKFDSYLSVLVPVPASKGELVSSWGLDPSLSFRSALMRRVHAVLLQALGNRVTRIVVSPGQTSKPKKNSTDGQVVVLRVGLLLDPLNAFRVVELGPTAEDKAAAGIFRQLWGGRSVLRRFPDGRILEAVLFTHLRSSKHRIIPEIAEHVLTRHVVVTGLQVRSLGHQFDSTLKLRASEEPQAAVPQLNQAYDELIKLLRGIRSVPLSITNMHALEPAFRFTSPFPPQPISQETQDSWGVDGSNRDACDSLREIPVVMQFESSSKWPDDLAAIARIKTAFYLKMSQELKGSGISSVVAYHWVDIFVQGFLFRLRIFHKRELLIHKADAREMALTSALDKGDKIDLGTVKVNTPQGLQLERQCVWNAHHASTLKGVSQRFPLFGPAVRLARRWVSAHMLQCHLAMPAVELLVAASYCDASPFVAPGSAFSGFVRFIRFLATHPFALRPVVVDLIGDMKPQTYSDIMSRFETARETKAGPPLYLATAKDPDSRWWTSSLSSRVSKAVDEGRPNRVQLEKIVMYARGTLKHLMSLSHRVLATGLEPTPTAWLSCFKTPLGGFDCFLVLDPAARPRHVLDTALCSAPKTPHRKKKKRKTQAFKQPLGSQGSLVLPLVGLKPADLLLRDLRHQFSRWADFSHDALGGHIIAVKWKPGSFVPRKFNVSRAHCAMPLSEDDAVVLGKVIPDSTALIARFQSVGQGLVLAVFTSLAALQKSYDIL